MQLNTSSFQAKFPVSKTAFLLKSSGVLRLAEKAYLQLGTNALNRHTSGGSFHFLWRKNLQEIYKKVAVYLMQLSEVSSIGKTNTLQKANINAPASKERYPAQQLMIPQ